MRFLPLLFEYFETNHFTLIFLAVLGFFAALRFLKLPRFFSSETWFYLALGLGFALRLWWLSFSGYTPQTEWNPQHMLESDVTNIHAIDLTRGVWFHGPDGMPAARRPIGYPLFLGLLYKIFGVHAAVAYASSLILYALTAWLLFQITQTIFNSDSAVIAIFLFAIYPISIFSVKLVTDEHLFLPVWLFGIYLLIKEIKERPLPWALFWYGILFGFAAITRTHAVFMAFIVAFAYALLHYSWKKVLTSFFAVMFVMQLVNLPWALRNYRVWGHPVIYTITGEGLFKIVNPFATPEGNGRIPERGEEGYSEELERAQSSGNEGWRHAAGQRAMLGWMRTHPLKFLDLGTARVLIFMGWMRTGIWPLWYQFSDGAWQAEKILSQKTKDWLEEAGYAYYYALFFSWILSAVVILRKRRTLLEIQRLRYGYWQVFSFFGVPVKW